MKTVTFKVTAGYATIEIRNQRSDQKRSNLPLLDGIKH